MNNCQSCGTEFKFGDVLKGANPASVKCSGCPERIKSSYLALSIALALFTLIVISLWTLDLGANAGMVKLLGLGVVGLAFEFGYFFLLSKGIIKSNLNIQNTP